MKKILAMIAILALALSVCACSGDKDETTDTNRSNPPEQSVNSSSEPDTTSKKPETSGSSGTQPDTTGKDPETGDKTSATTPKADGTGPQTNPDEEGWGELIPLD